MRTAEEYWNEMNTLERKDYKEIAILAINEARKECIDECAKVATARVVTDEYDLSKDAIVNKQSILKLKEQIK